MLLIAILCLLLYFGYKKIITSSNYWKKRNIFHINLWDNLPKIFFFKKSIAEAVKDAYDEFPDRRYFGSYQFFRPLLYIRDVNLIKQITVRDFDHFPNHFGITTQKTDPLMTQSLLTLKGQQWRDVRATLSPAFTSSKMRAMLTLIIKSATNFTNYFQTQNGVIELEMKDVFSRYTNDVIANCAFGIECDSLKDENNEFFSMGKYFTQIRISMAVKGLLNALLPGLFQLLKISLFPQKVTEFFKTIITESIKYRESNNIVRPDMINLLMEARNGKLRYDQSDKDSEGFAAVEESNFGKTSVNMPITDDLITAQALLFFLAGFETTSSALSFISHELVANPGVQKKLQQEIDCVLEKSSGEILYDDILKMKYMDQVVSETLRKYPPTFVLNRECDKNYTIPAERSNEETVEIEKGCNIVIPIYGIHMDPKFFPNPQKFDPERFSNENKCKIVPGSYLPFGSGPRNCIGSRFALLESKALLFSLLSKFDLVATNKTVIPLRLSNQFSLGAKDGFWIGLQRRKFEKCE